MFQIFGKLPGKFVKVEKVRTFARIFAVARERIVK